MKILGYMVVIKRTGADGTPIPLTNISCSVGRNSDCDIRVILPSVSSQHCRIDVDPCGKAYITNVSQCNHTLINDSPLAGEEVCILGHKDIITIADRQFRWEYPEGSVLAVSVKRDQVINYKILSPSTKSRVGLHNLNGDSGGTKRKNAEADVLLDMQEAKRKKVSFGPQLNPEHFDKLLPPATPVSKGEKPNTQSLLNFPDSPCLNANMRKSLRVSHTPVDKPISEESGMDTPTKSLLRRRSPTPVKPYIARSLGLFAPKVLDTESSFKIHTDKSLKQKLSNIHEGSVANSPTHDIPIVDNCPKISPEKSPRLTFLEIKNISKLDSPKCPEAVIDSCKLSGTSKSPKSDSSRNFHKVIVSKAKKHSNNKTPCKSPKRCRTVIKPESPQNVATSSMKYTDIQTLSNIVTPKISPKKEATHETSPKKVLAPKTSPKKVESPKSLGYDSTQKVATHTSPSKLKTPETQPKKLSSKTSPDKVATPKTSKKLEVSRASQKQVGSPNATPKKVTSPRTTEKKPSPRVTPKKVASPRMTPKKRASPRVTPKKVTSPRMTPKKVASPRGTPKVIASKVASRKTTPKKTTSPKATVMKVVTPKKIASPKSPLKKIESPKSPLKKMASPKSPPKKMASPKSPPKKMASPISPPKKMASPKSPPKKMASPKSTSKMASPKSPSKKTASPKLPPKKMASPKSPPKKISSPKSPLKKIESPKSPPKKMASPKSPPKKMASPKSPPKKMASPISPPKKMASPKSPPKKMASPKSTSKMASPKSTSKMASPKSPSKKTASPKLPPKKMASPKSPPKKMASSPKKMASPQSPPKKVASPQSPPKKVASPHSPPKKVASPQSPPKKVASPQSPPKKVASPKSPPKKVTSPQSPPKKVASPQSPPKKVASPQSPPKKVASPPREISSPQSVSKEVALCKSPKATLNLITTPTKVSPKTTVEAKSPRFNDLAVDVTSPKKLRAHQSSSKITSPNSLSEMVVSPSPPPKMVASPISSPTKVACFELSPKKIASPLSTPKKALSPQVSPKLSPSKATLSESFSKEVLPKSPSKEALQNEVTALLEARRNYPRPARHRKSRGSMTPKLNVSKRITRMTAGTPKSGHKMSSSKGKTPTKLSRKTPKKSWADVLKSGLMAHGIQHSKQVMQRTKAAHAVRKGKLQRKHLSVGVTKSLEFERVTTGHANSPAPIFIHEKTSKTPRLFKKGRKIPPRAEVSKLISKGDAYLDGLAGLMATPKGMKDKQITVVASGVDETAECSGEITSPKTKRRYSMIPVVSGQDNEMVKIQGTSPKPVRKTRSLCTNTPEYSKSDKDPSSLNKSHAFSPTKVKTPTEASAADFEESLGDSLDHFSPTTHNALNYVPSVGKRPLSYISTSTSYINTTNFDFSSVKTPDVTEDNYVSPLVTPTTLRTPERVLRSYKDKLLMTSPEDIPLETDITTFDFENAHTPDFSKDHFVSPMSTKCKHTTPGANYSFRKSPRNHDLSGTKILSTPKLMNETPKGTQPDVHEIKRILRTPKTAFSTPRQKNHGINVSFETNVTGIDESSAQNRTAESENEVAIAKVGKQLRNPNSAPGSPKADHTNDADVRDLTEMDCATAKNSPENDYPNMSNVKLQMMTPKVTVPKCKTDDAGTRRVLRTPRPMAESPVADDTNVAGLKKLMNTPTATVQHSPEGDYTDVTGVKKLIKTPKAAVSESGADDTHITGIRKVLRTPKPMIESTKADYTKVAGLKKLLKTPNSSAQESPKADYTNVAGIKKLVKTPKAAVPEHEADDTHIIGIRKVLRTPKPVAKIPKADYTNVAGVKKLMKTPDSDTKESPKADYTNVKGVKKLLKTPKADGKEHEADYTHVAGVRKILQTPKPRVESPKADYTDVSGVKGLMKSPNATFQKSPEADYTNVAGVKKLMNTPKAPVPEHEADDTHVIGIRKILRSPKLPSESPKADYTNIVSVKRLLKTPNKAVPKQCTADYSNVAGIKRLLRSPRQAPKETEAVLGLQKKLKTQRKTRERNPDYREPKGLKRLLATPRQKQFSPLSDYTNVAGLKNILATPHSPVKSPEADYTNVYGVRALMRTPKIRDDFVDVDLEGLGQLLKSPLTDQTNVIVGRAVELANHSSNPGSGRKLRRSPKVISPATSSPSENILPLEEISRNAEALKEQVQDGGSTPRRSQRNAKVKVQEVTTPVRRGRSRKGIIKEADSIENDVDGSVLKLIKASPVVPERRLRSKKGVCSIEESSTRVIRKKSKRTQKASSGRSQDMDLISQRDQESSVQTKVVEHEHYDDSVDEANKVATKKKQPSSPKKVNSDEVNLDNSSQLKVDFSPLPGSRRRNDKQGDLDLPTKTHGRRGKQNRMIGKEDSTEPASLIVEDTIPRVLSSGSDVELKSKESVATRNRRKQTGPDIAEEQTKTHTRRGCGRRKAAQANEVSAKETSKIEARSVHDDECVDTGRVSPGLISENKPTPRKLRKIKVQDGELDYIQEVTEICCQIQDSSKKEEVTSKRGRSKAAEKPENGFERQLRGRKNCSKQTHRVKDKSETTSDEQESEISPNGYTESPKILKDSASEYQTTKRKRGNSRLNSKIVHEIVTEEPSEDLLKATEKEQKSSCRSSNKKVKNQDFVSESIMNEDNEPDLPQPESRLTRSKRKDPDTVETPTRKRRAHAAIEEVETTRVTRSRNKSTKTEDLPAKVTRQTRSCK